MKDTEFINQFSKTTLAKSEFNHLGHLRCAWIYLSQNDFITASTLITAGIKRYAASLGASHIYHETLTRAWIQLVANAIKAHPKADCFDSFIRSAPELLDKNAPLQLYSKAVLESKDAKSQWLPSDLVPF